LAIDDVFVVVVAYEADGASLNVVLEAPQ